MIELQIKLERLELMLLEDGYNDSNIVYQTLKETQEIAINYSRCCDTLLSKEEIILASKTKSNHKYNELNSDLNKEEIDGFVSGCNWFAKIIKQ